jgi:hypothetical protein
MKWLSMMLAGFLAIALPGCGQPKTSPAPHSRTNTSVATPTHYLPYAQTNLARMKLFIGGEELNAELALKPTEIFTGMMWRTNMNETDGMLFAFGMPDERAFYMKNTYVPLSIAYIDPEGIIQEIHDLHPLNETAVPSASDNIQYVLEVKQGWFRRHNISTGTLIRTPFGELKNTFRPAR